MKAKKSLKFSKETVILLDKTPKKSINGGSLTDDSREIFSVCCDIVSNN